MRDHRNAARRAYPVHRLRKRRPLVLNETGLAVGQETAKRGVGIRNVAALDHVAREMRATQQLGIARKTTCAFKRTLDAGPLKIGGNFFGAYAASSANV